MFIGYRVWLRHGVPWNVVELVEKTAVERPMPTDVIGIDHPEPKASATVSVGQLRPDNRAGVLDVARTLPQWFTDRGIKQLTCDLLHQSGLVAEQDGAPVGFLSYYVAEGNAHIGWMGVMASRHRGGIGRTLIENLARNLQGQGIEAILVDTLGDSVDYEPYGLTRAFYRSVEFVDHARVKQDDPEWPDRLTLRRVLD